VKEASVDGSVYTEKSFSPERSPPGRVFSLAPREKLLTPCSGLQCSSEGLLDPGLRLNFRH
jgi:hypothetical protein